VEGGGSAAARAPGELDRTAGEQHDDDQRAGEHRGERPGEEVGDPPQPRAVTARPEARPGERHAGIDHDGDDRGGRARADSRDPRGRVVLQRHGGDRQHQQQARQDEREGAGSARGAPGAVDAQLRRGRSGQQLAGGVGVLELARGQPPPAVHDQLPQQRDVRGRPAEADRADPPPLPQDRAERDRGHGARL